MEMTPTLPMMAIFLRETTLKSVAVALMGLLALRLLRGAAPALRHRVALATFVLLMFLPVTAFLPGIPTNAIKWPRFLPFAAPETSPVMETTAPPIAARLPVVPRSETRLTPDPAPPAPSDAAPPKRSFLPLTALFSALWTGLTLAFLVPLTLGLWRLRRLYQAAAPAGGRVSALAGRASLQGKIAPAAVRFSGEISVPVAFGWRRPVIVLPNAAADWEDARLYAALLHESAHIARRDFAAQCLARAVCALYAWNPIIWKLYAILRAEAETDCDARAVALGSFFGMTAPDYAAHLFAIAKQAGNISVSFAPAMVRKNRPHLLEERIQRILTPRIGVRRRRAVLILSVAALCAVTIAGLRSAVARASSPFGARSAADAHFQTPDAPEAAPRNPVSFLRWSLRQYARAKTFSARWTWDLQFPDMAKGFDTGPTHIRTLIYAAPNKFRVSAAAYQSLEHLFISDGKKFIVLARGYGDDKPDEYAAPVSLAYATEQTFDHPHFGGGAIYTFFGGPAGMTHLLGEDLLADIRNGKISKTEANLFYMGAWKERTIKRLSGPQPYFGEDVSVNGEPCKTLIFSGGVYADERRAIISLRDGFVRRLEYREFPRELTPVEAAAGQKSNEKEYASDHFKNFPLSEQESLRAIFDESAKRQKATLTIEEFTDIKVNAPLEGNPFDTTFRFPEKSGK